MWGEFLEWQIILQVLVCFQSLMLIVFHWLTCNNVKLISLTCVT